MSDFDKQQWQAEQEARDSAIEAQRDKWAKARARSARNARRKLERLQRKLSETDDLNDWESEFTESVTERLDQFGSAFHDPQLGRPGDALSMAQKRVVAGLNKRVKDMRKSKSKGKAGDDDSEGEGEDVQPKPRSSFKPKSGFKPKSSFKSKTAYTPNVRRIEDEIFEEPQPPIPAEEPFIPEYVPEPKRPFLRVVK